LLERKVLDLLHPGHDGESRRVERIGKQNSRQLFFQALFSFDYTERWDARRVPFMKTNSLYLLAIAGAVVLFCLAAPQSISGQNAVSSPALVVEATGEVPPAVLALVNELTAQNKQLAANQAAMDAKIEEITESVRQARLFTARAGRGAK